MSIVRPVSCRGGIRWWRNVEKPPSDATAITVIRKRIRHKRPRREWWHYSGEILWNYKNWDCYIPIPPIVDAGKNRLYVGAGYRSGCALFEVKKNKNRFVTEEIFKTMDFGTHIHPPILHDDHFYAHCSDSRGRQDGLSCMSMDGKIMWQSKKAPIFNKGGFIIADGLIISVDGKFGILYLTEANPKEFRILSKVRLLDKSRCWAPLALSRGKLIIRDDDEMKCLLVKQTFGNS